MVPLVCLRSHPAYLNPAHLSAVWGRNRNLCVNMLIHSHLCVSCFGGCRRDGRATIYVHLSGNRQKSWAWAASNRRHRRHPRPTTTDRGFTLQISIILFLRLHPRMHLALQLHHLHRREPMHSGRDPYSRNPAKTAEKCGKSEAVYIY